MYSYDENEGVYYMDTSVLKAGDVLYKTDSQETYTVSKRATLIGVYNVNKGYADFKQINILYRMIRSSPISRKQIPAGRIFLQTV